MSSWQKSIENESSRNDMSDEPAKLPEKESTIEKLGRNIQENKCRSKQPCRQKFHESNMVVPVDSQAWRMSGELFLIRTISNTRGKSWRSGEVLEIQTSEESFQLFELLKKVSRRRMEKMTLVARKGPHLDERRQLQLAMK